MPKDSMKQTQDAPKQTQDAPKRDSVKQDWLKKFYYALLYAWYALYAVALLGIATVAPAYLDTVNSVLKYFIIAFLLVRFNPWVDYEMTAFDRTIVFSAAFFLLASTAAVSLITNALK